MRRALLQERQLDALRERCGDLGLRLIVEVDRDAEATVLVGSERFAEFNDAVAHVAALESGAGAYA